MVELKYFGLLTKVTTCTTSARLTSCVNTQRSAVLYNNAARWGRHALTAFILRFSRYIALYRKTLQTTSRPVFLQAICRVCTNPNIQNIISAAEHLFQTSFSFRLRTVQKYSFIFSSHFNFHRRTDDTSSHLCCTYVGCDLRCQVTCTEWGSGWARFCSETWGSEIFGHIL